MVKRGKLCNMGSKPWAPHKHCTHPEAGALALPQCISTQECKQCRNKGAHERQAYKRDHEGHTHPLTSLALPTDIPKPHPLTSQTLPTALPGPPPLPSSTQPSHIPSPTQPNPLTSSTPTHRRVPSLRPGSPRGSCEL